jgi:hypothetical protein
LATYIHKLFYSSIMCGWQDQEFLN